MDSFNIFILNNVKPGLKIILCQQNEVVSEIKVLNLLSLFVYDYFLSMVDIQSFGCRFLIDLHAVQGIPCAVVLVVGIDALDACRAAKRYVDLVSV